MQNRANIVGGPYNVSSENNPDWTIHEMIRPCLVGIVIHDGESCLTAKKRSWLVNQPPLNVPPPRNKGLIFGLIKGNQWLISPDHKAGYFWGGYVRGGWLTSH